MNNTTVQQNYAAARWAISLSMLIGVALPLWGAIAKPLSQPARTFGQPRKYWVNVVDLRTGKVRPLAAFDDWKLSPSGKLIVGGQETDKGYHYRISVIPVAGGAQRSLMNFPVSEPYAALYQWSADSSRVTIRGDYNDARPEQWKHTFRVGGASPTRRISSHGVLSPSVRTKLKRRFSNLREIVFSPDGRWVAAYCEKGFYQDRNYQGGIYVFRPDGSQLTQVTHNVSIDQQDADDREVQWLPDGSHLVFRRTSYEDEG